MKILSLIASTTTSMFATGVATAQTGHMMNGEMWNGGWMGGYGWMWAPTLLVVVVIGIVAWIVKRGGK